MPDTGAPWNIPYADPTDLVRDWPDLSEDVADAVALGLSAAGNAGIGSNVVQAVKTNAFDTTSTSFTTLTGLSLSFTPSSATSKVLLIAQINFAQTNIAATTMSSHFKFAGGNSANYVSTVVSGFGFTGAGTDDGSNLRRGLRAAIGVYVDSPSTASAITYSIEVKTNNASNQIFINRGDGTATSRPFGASSLTAIEVAP